MRSYLAVALCVIALAAPQAASSQGATVPFGGLSHDSSAPVEVTADQLDIDQKNGIAIFTGNVLVGQAELRMRSPRLRVEYARKSEGGAGGEIEHMIATGGVVLTNRDAVAESREADYTVSTGEVIMTGDVVITQDQNVLAGDRFVVQLKDGTGVMTGRVRTILQQSEAE